MDHPYLLKICIAASIILFAGCKRAEAQENWIVKSPKSTKISAVETTPWGLLAGENDSRIWLEPFNGVYISDDIGSSWSSLGLEGRGITDIEFEGNLIYSSTYYFLNGEAGLFSSNDGGSTWVHLGNNFSTSAVSAGNNTIYLGTYSHGLWVSFDKGETWEQKIGEGFYGPTVFSVESLGNTSIVSLENSTFITRDGGESWEEILVLNGINIRNIKITNHTILLGAENRDGIFKSSNNGIAWENVQSWGKTSSGAIEYYRDEFYAGRLNEQTQKYDIYKSEDNGTSWESTGLLPEFNNGQILDIAWLFSDPIYLFALLPYEGVYRNEISLSEVEYFPFLKTPWSTEFENEYIDKITSFFDHEYPLAALEPHTSRDTLINYLGIRRTFPYSGHKGYDYSLKYGTPILAAFGGYATYFYDPNLGNSIKIDHPNGYSTIYSHLQEEGLVNSTGIPVWVESKEQVGLVGMTGSTTGSHLHFEVLKDKNVDPYGWQSINTKDPWEELSGEKSMYLWNHPLTRSSSYFNKNGGEISLENKRVIIDQNSSEHNFTVFIEPYTKPTIPISQKRLTYVTGTSLMVNILNNLGLGITDMLKPTKIEIDFSNADLTNIDENSLKIYSLNEETNEWEELPSVLDLAAKLIISEVVHFSQFAVLGEKIDYEPPSTSINIEGEIKVGWYTSSPTVALITENTTDKTYYSINNSSWLEYLNPFTINQEGVNTVEYRSEDAAGNTEETKAELIKLDTTGKRYKTLSIYDSEFITE